MLKLKTYMIEPQGGWVYRIDALKIRTRASGFNLLIQTVRDIMKHNQLPIPENLAELIEDYVCRNTAKVFVANPDDDFLGMATRNEVIDAVNKLPRSLPSQFPESDRIAICLQCKFNVPTVCLTCDGLAGHFISRLPQAAFCHEPKLHTCQIDCLPGMVTVANSLEAMKPALYPRIPYPAHCWKKEEAHATGT